LFEFRFERKQVNENLDDIKAQVPKLELNQVTEEFDYYANKLRLIDAAIQQANWTAEITVNDSVWIDFPKSKEK
jgi:3-methyladenine DNA glycosylase AlkC